jgi:hypothetical protein
MTYKGPTRREREIAWATESKRRNDWINTPIPKSREELIELDMALMKLFTETAGYKMTIELDPPGYDSQIGSYSVTLVHPKGSVRGGGIHLYDAVWSARAKLYDLMNTPVVETVLGVPTTPKAKASVKDLFL